MPTLFPPLPDTISDAYQGQVHRIFPLVPDMGVKHIDRLLGTANLGPTDVMEGEPLSFYWLRTSLHSRAMAGAPADDVRRAAGEYWDFAWRHWREELKVDRPAGVHAYGWGLWLLVRDHHRAPLLTFDKTATNDLSASWEKRLARLDQKLATVFASPQQRWEARWAMLHQEAAHPFSPRHAPHVREWTANTPSYCKERHLLAGLFQALQHAAKQPDERAFLLSPGPDGRRWLWAFWEVLIRHQDNPAWQAWPDHAEHTLRPQSRPCHYALGEARWRFQELTPDPVLDRGAANLLAETLRRCPGVVPGAADTRVGELARWPVEPSRVPQTLISLDYLDTPILKRHFQLRQQAPTVSRPRPRA